MALSHGEWMTSSSEQVEIRTVSDVRAAPPRTTAVFVRRLDDEIAAALSTLPLEEIKGDGSPQITDTGMASLGKIRSLEFLDLEWASEITDQGLEHLHGVSGLKWVDLGGCFQVSAAAIGALEKALPQCVVETLADRPDATKKQRGRDLRKIKDRCPACLQRLPRISSGTRKMRHCDSCGSTYRPDRSCPSCSTNRVWSGPLGDFCHGCGRELAESGAS